MRLTSTSGISEGIRRPMRCFGLAMLALSIAGGLGGCAAPAPLAMGAAAVGVASNLAKQDVVHVVRYGETLGEISQKYTGTVNNYLKIAKYNHLSDPNTLYEGQEIRIPHSLLQGASSTIKTAQTGGSRSAPKAKGKTDTARTVSEGAVIGGLGGALLGTLICGSAKCAAVGGLGGAAAGALAGHAVANKKGEYVAKEEALDAEIQHAKQVRRKLIDYNKRLETVIGALDRRVASLRARIDSGQASLQELKTTRSVMLRLYRQNQKLAAKLKQDLEAKRSLLRKLEGQKGGDAREKALREQIRLLKANIKKLEQETEKLAKLDERLST